jgi:hypothetical protein
MPSRRVIKPPKKAKEPRWETHVYLNEADYLALKRIADQESRSVTMQLQHFVRLGIRSATPKQPE